MIIDLLFGLLVGVIIGFILGLMAMMDMAVSFAGGCAAAIVVAEMGLADADDSEEEGEA